MTPAELERENRLFTLTDAGLTRAEADAVLAMDLAPAYLDAVVQVVAQVVRESEWRHTSAWFTFPMPEMRRWKRGQKRTARDRRRARRLAP